MSHAPASRLSGARVTVVLALLTALAASQAAAAGAASGPAVKAAATVTFGEAFEACPMRATLRRLRRGADVGAAELATCRTLDPTKPYRVVIPASPSPTGEVWIKVEPDTSSPSLWVNARPGSATVAG
jgi:hypothetical protein